MQPAGEVVERRAELTKQERRYQRFAALWRTPTVNRIWDRLPMSARYTPIAKRAYADAGVTP